MSTLKKPEVDDCLHLGYKNQHLMHERYLAEPAEGFGVCIYTIGRTPLLHCQCFPMLENSHDTHASYCSYVAKLATARYAPPEEKRRRGIYPFSLAPDVLTLRCQIDAAVDNWRAHEHQSHEADPATGEGVE